jgi:hypothetical protein
MNPSNAVGLVVHVKSGVSEEISFNDLAFLGTCFSFRHPTYFLTAAHCIGNLPSDEVAILSPNTDYVRSAKEVKKHPSADIAIIELSPVENDITEPFWNCVSNYGLAEEFIAFGFPEDIFGEDARIPTARVFKGYFQRFINYRSRFGYTYKAGELNIPCPGGLSGGPLFRPGAFVMLLGLVTENLESTTFLHSVEEIQKDGKILREHYQNVINYGVCLMLDGIKEWLDANIPQRT